MKRSLNAGALRPNAKNSSKTFRKLKRPELKKRLASMEEQERKRRQRMEAELLEKNQRKRHFTYSIQAKANNEAIMYKKREDFWEKEEQMP